MEKRIKTLTAIVMLGVIVTAVFAAYWNLSWVIPNTITDPDRWLTNVEDPSLVNYTLPLRAAMFINFIIFLTLQLYVAFLALRVLHLYWKGTYFSDANFTRLVQVGTGLTLVTLYGMLVTTNVHRYIYALSYSEAEFKFRAYFDIETLTILACGVFFCVIGYIMKLASELKAENESIV